VLQTGAPGFLPGPDRISLGAQELTVGCGANDCSPLHPLS
jgi:hypothetical protein